MRAQAALESAAQQPVTTTMLRKFAAMARKRMRIEGGGYRRDHLRALAQTVEVADREVRIMGSKSELLRTLAAISGVKSATGGVRSSVLGWRKGWDSNPRYPCRHAGFQDRCLKPLGHPSQCASHEGRRPGLQAAGRFSPIRQQGPRKKQPILHHVRGHPISAAFGLRYVHSLVRRWAVPRITAVERLT
jgi:hypothetical protein